MGKPTFRPSQNWPYRPHRFYCTFTLQCEPVLKLITNYKFIFMYNLMNMYCWHYNTTEQPKWPFLQFYKCLKFICNIKICSSVQPRSQNSRFTIWAMVSYYILPIIKCRKVLQDCVRPSKQILVANRLLDIVIPLHSAIRK